MGLVRGGEWGAGAGAGEGADGRAAWVCNLLSDKMVLGCAEEWEPRGIEWWGPRFGVRMEFGGARGWPTDRELM